MNTDVCGFAVCHTLQHIRLLY